jgi:hypothetical protein
VTFGGGASVDEATVGVLAGPVGAGSAEQAETSNTTTTDIS